MMDLVEQAVAAERDGLRARIESVNAEREALAVRVEDLVRQVVNLRADISTIAEGLRDEAIERDWCDEYGRFVDNMNGRTSEPHLQRCSFTFEASFQVNVRFTLDGRDYDDALSEMHSYIEGFSLDDGELDSVDVEVHGVSRT
jgi:hypothetical protein